MKTLSTAIETQIHTGISTHAPLHQMVRLYHFMFAFEGELSLKALKEVTGLTHHFCKVSEEQRLAILALVDTVSPTQEDVASVEVVEKKEEEVIVESGKVLYVKSTQSFKTLPDAGAWNRGSKLPETQMVISQMRKQLTLFKEKGYTKIVFENRLGCGLLLPLASKGLDFELIAIESEYGYKGFTIGTKVLANRRKEFFVAARKASASVRLFDSERQIFEWVQRACHGVLLITSSDCKDKGVMKAHHSFFKDHKVINLDKVRQEVNGLLEQGWLSSLTPLFPRNGVVKPVVQQEAPPVVEPQPVAKPAELVVNTYVTEEEIAGIFE